MNSRISRRSKPSGARARRTSVRSKYGTRLRLGSYIADIVPDGDKKPFIHHCIVQQKGSPQVLYLGQEATFDAALESGQRLLQRLVAPHRLKADAIYEFATVEALK
jgi:hypothetical protein